MTQRSPMFLGLAEFGVGIAITLGGLGVANHFGQRVVKDINRPTAQETYREDPLYRDAQFAAGGLLVATGGAVFAGSGVQRVVRASRESRDPQPDLAR